MYVRCYRWECGLSRHSGIQTGHYLLKLSMYIILWPSNCTPQFLLEGVDNAFHLPALPLLDIL